MQSNQKNINITRLYSQNVIHVDIIKIIRIPWGDTGEELKVKKILLYNKQRQQF
jgi:hypothetical protein